MVATHRAESTLWHSHRIDPTIQRPFPLIQSAEARLQDEPLRLRHQATANPESKPAVNVAVSLQF